jgi:hypothetical protein
VIVDKNSEMGLVVITERGYTVQQVATGQDVYFDQYTELALREGQACLIHGSSTVLYYKERNRAFQQNIQSPPRKPPPSQPQPPQMPRRQGEDMPSTRPSIQGIPMAEALPQPSILISTAEIKIRVQKDGHGHFTEPHKFEVFTITENLQGFFWWFAKRTGRGGELGPERLRITLKDVMPVAKTFDVYRGHFEAGFEEKFRKMKENIVVECEKAKAFLPELKEFSVLVMDPTWKGELD